MTKNALKGIVIGTTASVVFYISSISILSKEYNNKVKESEIYRTEKQYLAEQNNQLNNDKEYFMQQVQNLQQIIEQNNIDYKAMQEELNNQKVKLAEQQLKSSVNNKRYKVAIDMGHNLSQAKDTGASYNGMTEDTFTMEIGLRLKSILENNGIMVINTTPSPSSTTDSVKDSLDRRIDVANQNNVDLFLSIHLNSASSDASGVETWIKNDKSQNFGQRIADNISNDMQIPNRGVKISSDNHRGDLYVLKNSNVPAVLIECFFLTNQEDVKKYNVDKLANSIANAVITELERK